MIVSFMRNHFIKNDKKMWLMYSNCGKIHLPEEKE